MEYFILVEINITLIILVKFLVLFLGVIKKIIHTYNHFDYENTDF